MQNLTNIPADVRAQADAHAAEATAKAKAKADKATANRQAAKQPAKPTPAKAKPASSTERVAKPAKAAAKAKPDAEASALARQAKIDDTRAARTLAAKAVHAYYDGASLPFKAAADRFADLRTDKPAKRPSQRQAALIASMLLAGDNIKRDGTFTRGAFVIDGRNVQPETGCLSDMLGRAVSYVSGPLSGASQRDAVFKLDFAAAHSEITALLTPGALRTEALNRLASLGFKPKA